MTKAVIESVDQYLATHPPETRAVLERVRSVIGKALPTASEGIAYRMPVYKIDAKAAIYFAGWKKHYSIYPVSSALLDAIGADAAAHRIEKGTLRLSYSEPVPVRLIGRIARFRAAAVNRP